MLSPHCLIKLSWITTVTEETNFDQMGAQYTSSIATNPAQAAPTDT